ncbi:hypothetical protein EXIGLDRAFT_694555 [Exidia glandulosa HHB12029]|uniref:Uncharacterized protein n=1 Tax=Exidia glandulosa HHB12029 TaxID=1314781 RepID=A0A166MAK7_EXIGL|nr:hypothetical protein EXIGLDRAFT_694555 [Exidia glandulosa HHB12029]
MTTNDQNKPLHVIGAYDYLELIVMSVEPISRFETLRAIRSTCRQFMFVTAPLMRYELRVSRRYRTWFDDFTTFCALPLWTLVTSIRITSAFTDVNDDLRTIGTYLPRVVGLSLYARRAVLSQATGKPSLLWSHGPERFSDPRVGRCYGYGAMADYRVWDA